ncbi:plasmodesmata-located protein 2 isoform X1 [Daucus carota subsp. sativus]|uniref:Gnk2-homologous domain-containing protein n=1 Tax=Daucus carota subsp. sativus TaxID=79200 RepID=A0A164Z3Q2_DAUCS|nr:PREDICTED: cysteine-rich repeat secretory protein 3 isoform X1 [Daucus carota subsp. sativus]
MGFVKSQNSIFFLVLLILVEFSWSDDTTNFIYKGCANQRFQDPTGVYSQNLKTLFTALISQSTSAKFYKTTSGQGQSAISGLFQCRGDLSNADCNRCVSNAHQLFDKMCGPAVAARIHLSGCYMRYEISGFKLAGATDLLYKVCGATRVRGSGFDQKLGSALGQVEKGVTGGTGFYTGVYENVYVLGQCEGDLVGGDCVECVQSAEQKAKSDCGDYVSGQIFLQQCYVTYSYRPDGVPGTLPSDTERSKGKGSGQNTQKTVAIVVGGLVGSGLFIACLLVLKSAFKKKREVKY